MSVSYTLHPEIKQVVTEASGKITLQEFQSHVDDMHRLFNDGTLNEEWTQLTLLEAATVTEHNPIALVRSLAKKNPWPECCARAMVTDNQFVFALCRMYQQLTSKESNRMKVTHSRTEAEAYLAECREQTAPLSET